MLSGARHRLLVAHSDRDELSRLRLELERAGWQVCGTTEDGGQLLRMAWTMRPELVILDLALSGQSGLEVLGRLKEQDPQIKCLVLGAYCDEIYAEAIARGAAGVLSSPFSTARLLERVGQLLAPSVTEWTQERVEHMAQVIFANLRAPANLKGYRYMMEALGIVLRDRDLIARRNVFQELYEPIAGQYGATASQVERSMRSFTAHIFEKAERTMLERYLPMEDVARGRISNTRFLSAISGYIYRQNRREQLRSWWWA